MHAVVISEPGGPEVLQWAEVADPRPGPGEVLVEVAAAGVNRADLMQRQGLYPPPAGAPPYPGLECSGTVAALGDGVSGWHLGEQVCALLSGGGYAEQVVVPAGQLLPVPKGITLIEAAALPETACTVYSNVFLIAGLAAGAQVVFDYSDPPESLSPERRRSHEQRAMQVAALGEAWIAYFEADMLRAKLIDLSFVEIEDLGPAQIAERYFPDVPDAAGDRGGHVLRAATAGRG